MYEISLSFIPFHRKTHSHCRQSREGLEAGGREVCLQKVQDATRDRGGGGWGGSIYIWLHKVRFYHR